MAHSEFSEVLDGVDWRYVTRLTFATLLVVSAGGVAVEYVTAPARGGANVYSDQAELPAGERDQVVGDRPNITVVAGLESNLRETHALYAFGRDGRLRYFDDEWSYGDVDPSPAGARTVGVVRHDLRGETACAGPCATQQLVRINLTSGDERVLWSQPTEDYRVVRWHDADRVGTTDSWLVADIGQDRVWQLNTSTGVTEWAWRATAAFDRASGGPYPSDWTHVNDVERLPDGRVMLSLRNQDQVVFIHPGEGYQPEWTLGEDDEWGIMFEQHNPDYIPEENGGPAVIVSDSENNRVVEYQRRDGEWVLSWVWQDDRLDWPRDADRLPNGHTLITDSHGNRVLEIDRDGEVVWSAPVKNPYEAERLGTGDESTGGPSAVRANLTSQGPTEPRGATGEFPGANEAEGKLGKVWHGIKFVLPVWATKRLVLFAMLGIGTALAWGLVEATWRYRLRRPVVRR